MSFFPKLPRPSRPEGPATKNSHHDNPHGGPVERPDIPTAHNYAVAVMSEDRLLTEALRCRCGVVSSSEEARAEHLREVAS